MIASKEGLKDTDMEFPKEKGPTHEAGKFPAALSVQ